ncbi:TP53 regulating kinase, partial [Coelomomyces lativittatus]
MTQTTVELFKQGAEARIFRHDYQGHPVITKQRFRKSYRHPTLDAKLTQARILQEVRLLLKSRQVGLNTPRVLFVDLDASSLILEWIPGPSYRDYLLNSASTSDFMKEEGQQIGRGIAQLHQFDIIHGDLTTSNMLYHENQIFFIDFGLAYTSTLVEDKAVDLYVLEKAILSTHPVLAAELMESILTTYKVTFSESKSILRKLDE